MNIKDILNITIDTDLAIAFLEYCRKEGRNRASLIELLKTSKSGINDSENHLEQMRHLVNLRPKWNKSELADKLGISRTTIYKWEKYGLVITDPKDKNVDLGSTVELWEFLKIIDKD